MRKRKSITDPDTTTGPLTVLLMVGILASMLVFGLLQSAGFFTGILP